MLPRVKHCEALQACKADKTLSQSGLDGSPFCPFLCPSDRISSGALILQIHSPICFAGCYHVWLQEKSTRSTAFLVQALPWAWQCQCRLGPRDLWHFSANSHSQAEIVKGAQQCHFPAEPHQCRLFSCQLNILGAVEALVFLVISPMDIFYLAF